MIRSKFTGLVLDVARQRGGAQPGVVTLLDHSRYGNNGVMTDVTWIQLPSGLWVMSFNGTTSVVNCGNDDSIRYPTRFSYEVLATLPGTTDSIVDKFQDFNNYAMLGTVGNQFIVQVEAGGPSTYRYSASHSLNVFHHVVVVYDSSLAVPPFIYVNGVLELGGSVGTMAATGNALNNTGNLLIGNGRYGFWPDQIASIRIHNYALPPPRIRARFDQTKGFCGR